MRVIEPSAHQPTGLAWLHLDYHLLKVLVDGETVSAVLDWENVALGEAGADVARTLSLLSVDPGIWRLRGQARRTVRSFRRGYLAGYAEVADLPGNSPGWLTWAGEFMLQDLGNRLDAAELAQVARWTRYWQSAGRASHF